MCGGVFFEYGFVTCAIYPRGHTGDGDECDSLGVEFVDCRHVFGAREGGVGDGGEEAFGAWVVFVVVGFGHGVAWAVDW